MKKLISTLFLVLILCTAQTPRAHATLPVIDYTNASFNLKQTITQVVQLAKEAIVAVNAPLQTANTYMTMMNQTVFRPLQDAMMLVSIFKSADQIKSLILGINGESPLLITNPARYIRQEATKSMKLTVGYVDAANGQYSREITAAAIARAKRRSDIKGQLAACSRSTVPAIVQRDICSNSKLNELAINQSMDAQGNYTQAEVTVHKKEIYDSLCVGNPNGSSANEQALAERLITAGEKTGAGGWEKLMARTGGDNSFTMSNKCLALMEEEYQLRMETESADLARGNGIVSKVKCLVKVTNPVTEEEDCVEKAIQSTGYQLGEQFKSALGAPLDVLKQSYGTGGEVSSLLSTISSLSRNIGEMTNSINSVNTVLGGGSAIPSNGPNGDPTLQIIRAGSSGSGVTTVTTSTSSRTTSGNVTTTTTYEDDLTDNPVGETNMKKPFNDAINQQLDILTSLETEDRNYITAITSHLNNLTTGKGCYDSLITSFGSLTVPPVTASDPTPPNDGTYPGATFQSLANDGRVTAAISYYTVEIGKANTLKSTIQTELDKVPASKTLVTGIKTKVANSKSSQEIFDELAKFTVMTTDNSMPSMATGVTNRESDVLNYKSDADQANADHFSEIGDDSLDGEITKKTRQCQAIRTAEQTARDAAWSAFNIANAFTPGN